MSNKIVELQNRIAKDLFETHNKINIAFNSMYIIMHPNTCLQFISLYSTSYSGKAEFVISKKSGKHDLRITTLYLYRNKVMVSDMMEEDEHILLY